MLRWEARDEGRSLDYDAEERNEADGHFVVQTRRGAAFRAICFVACLANGVDHSLRPASRISSRKASAATPRGSSTALLRLLRPRHPPEEGGDLAHDAAAEDEHADHEDDPLRDQG